MIRKTDINKIELIKQMMTPVQNSPLIKIMGEVNQKEYLSLLNLIYDLEPQSAQFILKMMDSLE
jgi:hypothetical protein